ncbi:MAG: enoyl-CoA hydratase/isomerase family protein, partial [Halioglobus sp.]|nr:enoyl-CoA hydratase/isomerase family protein [Halioglobus sp.]
MQTYSISRMSYALLPIEDLPDDAGWLLRQPHPVIALGATECLAADVVVADEAAATPLITAIERQPDAALVLVQLLRATEDQPLPAALSAESLAYGLLQEGAAHQRWLAQRDAAPELIVGQGGPAIELTRDGNVLKAALNRPENRNAITVEMRDALVELFELVALDSSIERLDLVARGACFSVGGELREFGLSAGGAEAHRVRSLRHPGRELAAVADRVHCHLHSACIGSGIEIPA